jgi:tetratricopeptide repeat protein
MDAKLYLNKAIMQLSRGLEEGGVQSLKAALEGDGDEVSKTRARVILGEYFVMKGRPAQAKEHLGSVAQDAERLRDQYDDLLDDEICRADMLLDMIERFGFLAE